MGAMVDDGELDERERARARRRDEDMNSAAKSGMRSGLAKGFKQIQDAQARRGRAAANELEQAARTKAARRSRPA
jgi:hypothetical protein